MAKYDGNWPKKEPGVPGMRVLKVYVDPQGRNEDGTPYHEVTWEEKLVVDGDGQPVGHFWQEELDPGTGYGKPEDFWVQVIIETL